MANGSRSTRSRHTRPIKQSPCWKPEPWASACGCRPNGTSRSAALEFFVQFYADCAYSAWSLGRRVGAGLSPEHLFGAKVPPRRDSRASRTSRGGDWNGRGGREEWPWSREFSILGSTFRPGGISLGAADKEGTGQVTLIQVVKAMIRQGQGVGEPFRLVISPARSHGVHVSPVVLRLRAYFRIPYST